MRYTLALICLLTGIAQANPGQIEFPANYKDFVQYLSLDRTQNPDQIIRLFADPTALSGVDKNGQLPYGSTLVAEIYKAEKDAEGQVKESALGKRIRGKLALIAVMQRRQGSDADYPEGMRNNDWDFAAFKPDGSVANKDLNSCAACHAPLTEHRHLFSYQHLLATMD